MKKPLVANFVGGFLRGFLKSCLVPIVASITLMTIIAALSTQNRSSGSSLLTPLSQRLGTLDRWTRTIGNATRVENATGVGNSTGFGLRIGVEDATQSPLIPESVKSEPLESPPAGLTPLPPHRALHMWPRPPYTLAGHHMQPDRPHTLELGSASYALEPGTNVTELRVLTLQQWALSWEDQDTCGLKIPDLVGMGWQCLVCFSDPSPWGDDVAGDPSEKWPGVAVNGSGRAHPERAATQAAVDLECRRFNVTRIVDSKAEYGQKDGGLLSSLAYMCNVPTAVFRKSQPSSGVGGLHGWVSLIEGNCTATEVAAHFGGEGQPSLNFFAAIEDLTIPEADGPVETTAFANASSSPRLGVCHTTTIHSTTTWSPAMRAMLVEYLAWNKINGIRKLRIYYRREENMADWLFPLFDYFAVDGFLEPIEWLLPHVPTSFGGQLLLQYDCMYRAALDSDWILFGDFDELVASATVALNSWNETFWPYFTDPTVGEIQLRSWFFLGDCAVSGKGVKDLISSQLVYRKPESEGQYIRSKYWVRPTAATWTYVHLAGLKDGFRSVEVDSQRAHVRHYILSRSELLSVPNCTHSSLKAAGVQSEYGFPMVHQERLWAEVEAVWRYVDLATNSSGVVRKPGFEMRQMMVSDPLVG